MLRQLYRENHHYQIITDMNKKVRNATIIEYDGIKFKSKMEAKVYKELIDSGFDVAYENIKFVLVEGFKPSTAFYIPDKQKNLKLDTIKVKDITYTPDFTVTIDDKLVVIEVKGKPNDTYPLKRKLFRKYMEECSYPIVFFEIHTIKQLKIAIETMLKW